MLEVFLELAKLFLKLDQPRSALEVYAKGLSFFIGELLLLMIMMMIINEMLINHH